MGLADERGGCAPLHPSNPPQEGEFEGSRWASLDTFTSAGVFFQGQVYFRLLQADIRAEWSGVR